GAALHRGHHRRPAPALPDGGRRRQHLRRVPQHAGARAARVRLARGGGRRDPGVTGRALYGTPWGPSRGVPFAVTPAPPPVAPPPPRTTPGCRSAPPAA